MQAGQPLAHQVGGGDGAIQEIVDGQRRPLLQVVEKQQRVRHEQPEILRRAGLQAVGQRLEQAHEIVGEGAVQAQEAVVAAKVVQQRAHHLRDVVEQQPLVLGHRAAFAGHGAGDCLFAALQVLAAGELGVRQRLP